MRSFVSILVLLVFVVLAGPADAQAPEAEPASFYLATADFEKANVPRIQEHLEFMVDYLGAQDTTHLSGELRARRDGHIDRLADYARAGSFPRNRTVAGFNPIFIDHRGQACAVADLMIHSGAGELAHCVAERQNEAYLGDITVSGVEEWIRDSGLTAEECAMIQPAYPCFNVYEFTCTTEGTDVLLTWQLGDIDFDYIVISRDGEWIADLPGDATSFVDTDVPPGTYYYYMYGEQGFTCFDFGDCAHEHNSEVFHRGDASGDGVFDAITDSIYILSYVFQDGPEPVCMEAADVNGDGSFQPLVEVLHALGFQYAGGPSPAAPYPDCGLDPDPGAGLGCAESTAGCP